MTDSIPADDESGVFCGSLLLMVKGGIRVTDNNALSNQFFITVSPPTNDENPRLVTPFRVIVSDVILRLAQGGRKNLQ